MKPYMNCRIVILSYSVYSKLRWKEQNTNCSTYVFTGIQYAYIMYNMKEYFYMYIGVIIKVQVQPVILSFFVVNFSLYL